MEWLKPGKDNREARMGFVKYWAKFVRTHSDKEWGRQQNVLINSVLKSATQLSRKEYLEIKKGTASVTIKNRKI